MAASGSKQCKPMKTYTESLCCQELSKTFENFLIVFETFLWFAAKFSKISQKYWQKMFAKYLSADACFVKTILLTVTICFLILGCLFLLGSPWNTISLEVLKRSISVAAQPFYLDYSFDFQKSEDESAYCPNIYELSQIIEIKQKFSLFSKDSAIV